MVTRKKDQKKMRTWWLIDEGGAHLNAHNERPHPYSKKDIEVVPASELKRYKKALETLGKAVVLGNREDIVRALLNAREVLDETD